MASGQLFKSKKLVGRSNYLEQLTNTNLFFKINSYMSYINILEKSVNWVDGKYASGKRTRGVAKRQ